MRAQAITHCAQNAENNSLSNSLLWCGTVQCCVLMNVGNASVPLLWPTKLSTGAKCSLSRVRSPPPTPNFNMEWFHNRGRDFPHRLSQPLPLCKRTTQPRTCRRAYMYSFTRPCRTEERKVFMGLHSDAGGRIGTGALAPFGRRIGQHPDQNAKIGVGLYCGYYVVRSSVFIDTGIAHEVRRLDGSDDARRPSVENRWNRPYCRVRSDQGRGPKFHLGHLNSLVRIVGRATQVRVDTATLQRPDDRSVGFGLMGAPEHRLRANSVAQNRQPDQTTSDALGVLFGSRSYHSPVSDRSME